MKLKKKKGEKESTTIPLNWRGEGKGREKRCRSLSPRGFHKALQTRQKGGKREDGRIFPYLRRKGGRDSRELSLSKSSRRGGNDIRKR